MSMVQCGHCGNFHQGVCPRVKSIEYYHDGCTVKRVEYHGVEASGGIGESFAGLPDHLQPRTII